jgi:NDP-sugar pyrophosphorylase family protein
VSQIIAIVVYFPMARLARALERRGRAVERVPLSAYRNRGLYAMRTDALDRFGTRTERRFTATQVRELLERAGLEAVTVDGPPYWCAVGYKGSDLESDRRREETVGLESSESRTR